MSAPVVAFSGLVLLIAALVAFLIWAGSDQRTRRDSANELDWLPTTAASIGTGTTITTTGMTTRRTGVRTETAIEAGGSDAAEALWNHLARGRVSRGGHCGDRRLLDGARGVAQHSGHLSTRADPHPGVELHVRRHRRPHVAPISPRAARPACSDGTTAAPVVVHLSWGSAAASPLVRGRHAYRLARLPVPAPGK